MSVKRLLAAVTVSAAAVLSLAACGGDDPLEPAAKDTPTPLKAANVQVDIPEPARANTAEGAVEFTKFYFDLLNQAFATGDYLPVVKLTGSGCILCRQTVGDVAFAYARGRIDGGAFTLSDVKAVQEDGDRRAVAFTYDEDKYTELDHNGDAIWDEDVKNDINAVVHLKWINGGWVLEQLLPNTKAKDSDK